MQFIRSLLGFIAMDIFVALLGALMACLSGLLVRSVGRRKERERQQKGTICGPDEAEMEE